MKINRFFISQIPIVEVCFINCPFCSNKNLELLDMKIDDRRVFRCPNCYDYYIENINGKYEVNDVVITSNIRHSDFDVS